MLSSFKNHFSVSALVVAFVAVPALAQTPTAAPAKSAAASKAAPAKADAGKETHLKVDVKASTVVWKGTKVTGAHNGKIKVKDGTLDVEGNELKGGTVSVDMKTISNDDLSDKSFNKKLVDHLSSDDFFGVKSHPVATLKITKVEALTADKDGNTHTITGDLTIKGKTEAVSFPAKVAIEAAGATAKGVVKIDRTKYDVRYGSGKFFENLGDKAIHDEFEIDFDLVAKK